MADFDSSLPTRTLNPGDIQVKVVDATVTSQQLAINSDGSVNITDNGASITVDGSVTVSATNLDIRDLTSVSDSVSVLQATHDNLNLNANIQVGNADVANGNPVPISDAGGSLTVDATNLDIRDLSAAQDNVAISDGTDTLAVNADGSINVAFAAGAEIKITDGTDDLAINADGSINSVVTATNLDIRDLTHASDSVKVGDGTDFLAVNNDGSLNITDNGGSITVDGSVTVSATDLDIRDLNSATDSVTVVATNLDVRDLSHSQDSVKIGDGTDFLAVNTDGSINVNIVDASPGTAINDYNTASAVAGGGTSNHDYTSTGNFYLNQIHASGSGKMKIEVLVNAVSKFVFFSSTANPNMDITLANPILATTGQVVRIIRTNKEGSSQDLYSTISGYNA